MTQSPFVTTAHVLNEASNSFDVLRIIAKDTRGLGSAERESIRQAADELEDAQRRLIKVYFDLQQTQQQLIAVNEQLIEARKAAAAKLTRFSMTGRMTLSSSFPRPYYGKL
jgi:hypothetical protein